MIGGPIDLTPFGSVLKSIGVLYWLLAAAAVGTVVRWKKSRRDKVLAVAFVMALFGFLPAYVEWQRFQARSRLDESMSLFAERCKGAGEKVTRVVDTDGLVWMKWRDKYGNEDNFADQFKLNDPYGRDCGLEDCIGNLLRVVNGASLNPDEASRHALGYQFVETIDPIDGQAYRYSAHLEHGWSQEAVDRHRRETGQDVPPFSYRFRVDRVPIRDFSARYGVVWEDISTRQDREHWIAGGSLRVVDLQTNEVIGERIGYMVDRGQGSQVGGRSPWLSAHEDACPAFLDPDGRATRIGMTVRFIRRVSRP